jgi:hypothetical protein
LAISIGSQLVRYALIDTDKVKKLTKDAKKLKKSKDYDQYKYIKLLQKKDDINFETIYITIITLVVMFTCLIWIQKSYPLMVFGHRLGFLGMLCLIIIEGLILKYILGKFGVK